MNENMTRILDAREWLRLEPATPREEQLFLVIRDLLKKIDELEAELGTVEEYRDNEQERFELRAEVEALRATIGKVREALTEHEV